MCNLNVPQEPIGSFQGYNVFTSEYLVPGRLLIVNGAEVVAITAIDTLGLTATRLKSEGINFNGFVLYPSDWEAIQRAIALLSPAPQGDPA